MITRRGLLKGMLMSAGGVALINPTNKVIFDFGKKPLVLDGVTLNSIAHPQGNWPGALWPGIHDWWLSQYKNNTEYVYINEQTRINRYKK